MKHKINYYDNLLSLIPSGKIVISFLEHKWKFTSQDNLLKLSYSRKNESINNFCKRLVNEYNENLKDIERCRL